MGKNKKIFILSNESDISTNNVIDWLNFLEAEFIRVNDSNKVEISKIILGSNDEIIMKIDKKEIDLNEVSSYWYRRGFLHHTNKYIESSYGDIDKFFNDYIYREGEHLIDMTHLKLQSKQGIGKLENNGTNKLNNLRIAKSCKLDIPATLVTSTKRDLCDFLNKNTFGIISKAIFIGLSLRSDYFDLEGYTCEISKKDLRELKESFSPTLFQEKLDKRYEIRTFYLDGRCYSSVIFSQGDTKTSIDFRNYNFTKPNRTPPFKLPNSIENKIKKFMNRVGMKSGSIDIVVTKNRRFVFLEVNPIGQYSQVSIPCNYNLDFQIAKYLIQTKHEE